MIVVFGSINIDLVVPVERLPRPGETVLGPGYRLLPGGKGANQSLAAARAGAEVRMIGRVGRDGFAELALQELRAAGVELTDVHADELPTGCALIPVDRSGENLIVVASGANRAAREHQVPNGLLGPATVVLLQMEVPLSENWSLVDRAKHRGARVILNCAPAGPVPHSALKALDYLVVNETEALQVATGLARPSGDPRQACREIFAATATPVIATIGADGAIAVAGESTWSVGVLPIEPVDTTGAGDAFVGAFAAAIAGGADLPAALHRASVAGGLACLKQGAQPSLPSKAAIDSRLCDLPLPVGI